MDDFTGGDEFNGRVGAATGLLVGADTGRGVADDFLDDFLLSESFDTAAVSADNFLDFLDPPRV